MSLQMFLKIDGVEGDARNFQHKNWSEILSWNWDMTSNRTEVEKNGNDCTSINEVSFVKQIGIDSADIRMLFAEGRTITRAQLSIVPVVEKKQKQTKYLAMTFEDVRIKSVVTGGGIDDAPFKERITLLFNRVEFEFTNNSVATHANPDIVSEDYAFGWQISSDSEWKRSRATE